MSKALAGCNTSGHGDASDAGAMSKNVKMKTEETFSGIVIDLEGSNSLMPSGPLSQFESPKPKRIQDDEPTAKRCASVRSRQFLSQMFESKGRARQIDCREIGDEPHYAEIQGAPGAVSQGSC